MTDPIGTDRRGDEYDQEIVETIQQPLLVLSPDLRVLRANRAYYNTFHIAPAQVEGRILSELGSGEWDSPPLKEALMTAFSEGAGLQDVELTAEFGRLGRRTMSLNGRRLWLSGKPRAILLTMEDITERKQIEAALTASEIRYRRLFETAQDGILLVDAQTGEIVDANPFLEDLLGYTHDEMIGRKLWEMGPFKDVAASQAAFEQLQQERYIRYEDLPLETKGGRKINVEFVSNVYAVGAEEIIQCNIRDITERKLVEAALEVSAVRYRRLFETTQDGILLLHAHTGEIIDVNPFLEDLLEYTHDEMIGMKLWEVGPFRDVAAAKVAFEKLQDERYIRYEDLPLETKSGRKINVEFVSNVYTVDSADIIQCNIRDITERRHIEDQLHTLRLGLEERVGERTAELARANLTLQGEIVERERAEAREHTVVVEERTRMAREIHDTLAQGFTGVVIQLEAAEDVLVEDPEEARLHVLQARTLARESLAEARRSVWALRPVVLGAGDLGYAFLHLVKKLAEESGITIDFTLRGVLRPLNEDLELHLLRIGQEALTNALKHAQATEISVTLTSGEDHIALSVEDRGQGFDAESPAYRRGLGLRGIQERTDSLGGKLTLTSALGQGTRIEVVMPLPPDEGGSLGEEKSDQDSHSG
jgi:PAS domain S-box-containing protein